MITVPQLRPECVVNPLRSELSHIGAIMLWPDDPAQLSRAFEAAIVEDGKKFIPMMKDDPEMLRAFAKFAASAYPVEALQESAKRAFPSGFFAGAVLREAVDFDLIGWSWSMNKIVLDLCKRLRGGFQVQPTHLLQFNLA